MFCPNCGTEIKEGTQCPNCSCDATYAVAKVTEWENYIRAAEAYADSNGSKPAYKFKLGVLIPCVALYMLFIGWLLFGYLLGGTAFAEPIDKFYSTLESSGFTDVGNHRYIAEKDGTYLVFDLGEGYFGGYEDDYHEYYYYIDDVYKYDQNKVVYTLYAEYDLGKYDYTCYTAPSNYNYYCTSSLKSTVMGEASDVKEVFNKFLSNSGITISDLAGELNE